MNHRTRNFSPFFRIKNNHINALANSFGFHSDRSSHTVNGSSESEVWFLRRAIPHPLCSRKDISFYSSSVQLLLVNHSTTLLR
jgi:hypothetical protein